MTQGEKVKQIRKTLGLTLEKFGGKLGVGKTAISKIEKGENSLTDQMMKSICREYNVNYSWLAGGEGEMFTENDDAFQNSIDRIMHGENEARRNMFKALAHASDEEINAVERLIDYYLTLKSEGDAPLPPGGIVGGSEAEYIKNVLTSAPSTSSTASSTTDGMESAGGNVKEA